MKRFVPAFLVLLALLVGYWAWPFFDLRALGTALQAGDLAAINEEVDYVRDDGIIAWIGSVILIENVGEFGRMTLRRQ
jgi:hypothetical protein